MLVADRLPRSTSSALIILLLRGEFASATFVSTLVIHLAVYSIQLIFTIVLMKDLWPVLLDPVQDTAYASPSPPGGELPPAENEEILRTCSSIWPPLRVVGLAYIVPLVLEHLLDSVIHLAPR